MIESCISVIIPAHNAEKYLAESIDSALSQEDVDVEVIVVENGSSDNTFEVARSFGEKIVLLQSGRGGAQGARNVGLKEAKGRYLKFLDADDVLKPGVLAKQIEQTHALEAADRRAIVYGDLELIDEKGMKKGARRFRPRREDEHPIAHIIEHGPVTASPLHRTEWVREVGGMDETLPREHETNLHFRLILAGVEMVHYPEIIYKYRQHSDSSSLMGGGVAKYGPLWPLEYLIAREDDLKKHFKGRIPSGISEALAVKFWRDGRAILREGYAEEAKNYFHRARSLAGVKAINGSKAYRFLVFICGPIMAERFNHPSLRTQVN